MPGATWLPTWLQQRNLEQTRGSGPQSGAFLYKRGGAGVYF